MKINWLPVEIDRTQNMNTLINEEYKFRSRITRILIERMKDYNDADLEQIRFDFDTSNKQFILSTKTPEPIYSRILDLLD